MKKLLYMLGMMGCILPGQSQEVKNDSIMHGPMSPYIVPSMNYLKYFKETQIKPVIDAGISEIFLEEPEFWAYAGYSEAFKVSVAYQSEWDAEARTLLLQFENLPEGVKVELKWKITWLRSVGGQKEKV